MAGHFATNYFCAQAGLTVSEGSCALWLEPQVSKGGSPSLTKVRKRCRRQGAGVGLASAITKSAIWAS